MKSPQHDLPPKDLIFLDKLRKSEAMQWHKRMAYFHIVMALVLGIMICAAAFFADWWFIFGMIMFAFFTLLRGMMLLQEEQYRRMLRYLLTQQMAEAEKK